MNALRIGVAHLTALELNPSELVALSAHAGFRAVGLRTSPVVPGAIHYPLKAGSAAHRDLVRLLDDHDMLVREVEFIPLVPKIDVASYEPMFEAAAGLRAQAVTVSGDDGDFSRLSANFAALCDLAAGYGLRIDLEFMRWRHVGTLGDARRVLDAVARPNAAILVDALHLARSGGTPVEVGELPPAYLKAVQICDAPSASPAGDEAIIREAREGRLPPGHGALPLTALLHSLPSGTVISAEMPFAALGAAERLALAFKASKRVIEQALHEDEGNA
ncbi:xylose isomerase domain-containing protein [Caballeronia arationis]|uniref:Sugar phosphate isomerase/epimerase n=1 Tax=Caballeronia arationis TaxID=1777142 RepID=A0A7Z7IF07_9BURK|nr:sugar phosphate isomerase/epimerase [Caballeronia arationis]SAK66124.1 xylose isomerase domain-containing protein [Caballeronia arationis]SOE88022.1 Sugar phosphate isomerase/epimerase [Caballeronia arationis]